MKKKAIKVKRKEGYRMETKGMYHERMNRKEKTKYRR